MGRKNTNANDISKPFATVDIFFSRILLNCTLIEKLQSNRLSYHTLSPLEEFYQYTNVNAAIRLAEPLVYYQPSASSIITS